MPKFPYYIPEKYIYKPIIPIQLKYKNRKPLIYEPFPALIDSGCEVCLCSEEIAESLGIVKNKQKTIRFTMANGSEFSGYEESIHLSVGGIVYDCAFYISAHLPSVSPILLGQFGFFDHFKVSFDLQNLEIELVYNFSN